MGNVQCSLLQDGPSEAIERSARYCLKHAAPGGGYIFSTSNCVYTGMRLDRYELMLSVWRAEGNYPRPDAEAARAGAAEFAKFQRPIL